VDNAGSRHFRPKIALLVSSEVRSDDFKCRIRVVRTVLKNHPMLNRVSRDWFIARVGVDFQWNFRRVRKACDISDFVTGEFGWISVSVETDHYAVALLNYR